MNILKIILLGDSGVGKSRICNRYFKSDKSFENGATVGVDFNFKIFTVNNTIYRVHLWDTAGQERFRSIIRSYYRDIDASILVFDVTNKNSFMNIKNWIVDIETNSENKLIFLIGNKIDIQDNNSITDKEINNLLEEYPIINKFYTISAKTDVNLDNALNDIFIKSINYNQYNKYYNISINNNDNLLEKDIDSGIKIDNNVINDYIELNYIKNDNIKRKNNCC
tara:strand:- start:5000 stop:5668 length:669 start_codon:yes stop_codon:yes gene_type:complete